MDSLDITDLKSDSWSIDSSKLNDEEYNIPVYEENPTLESILNDDESSLLDKEELVQILTVQAGINFDENDDNLSVESSGICGSSSNMSAAITSSYKYDPGHILRHTVLKSVSAQLRSANERINSGHPSVMCISTMIAIGTNAGFVLVFDAMQTLRWCNEADINQSSVSALSFNNDCTRLLAGYSSGTILMFDVMDGRVLRTMNDVHSPFTAVLHLKFTDIPTLAVCSDSGGSVFELNFKRILGVRSVDSKCIFSGSRGEIYCVEPLLLYHLNTHPLKGSVLIAMATLTKLIVISIRPTMKILLTHPVRTDPRSLPFLSWQFVIIQLSENSRVMDPILAFARDHNIHFYQVHINRHKLRCSPLQKINLNYSLLTCHWLNSKIVAVLDIKEQLHLIDVRSKQELEVIDLSTIELIYNSSHFKGLSTGENVSKAMALAGERACYNTVQSYGSQLLFLGTKACHIVTVRSWIERLDSLVDKRKFECSLRLGMEFLEEKGKVVMGLKGPHSQRHNLVHTKIVEILTTYIDLILSGETTSVPVTTSMNTIINMAITLNKKHLIFERMWDGLENNDDTVSREIFLFGLCMAIMEEKLNNIPPAIMQKLVAYLSDLHLWKELELCILNVSIECLDIQQVLQLSRQHAMHCALISVWNRGMLDYVSPLHELLPKLKSALNTGRTNFSRDLGNKLLVYISCCLLGRAYPSGDIEKTSVEIIRNQIFQCLCSHHSINAEESEDIYPYLRILLQFDAKEFLNVLAMAFDDHKFSAQMKQRFVDILLLIISQNNSFQALEIGFIFTFLCKQVSSERSRLMNIDRSIYAKISKMLLESNDNNLEERQKVLLELLLHDNFHNFQVEDILSSAKNAGFYLVCSVIYEKQGQYEQILQCYLLDPVRKQDIFSFIEQSQNRSELHSYVLKNLEALLEINSEKTGVYFSKYCLELVEDTINSMPEKKQFYFLKGVLKNAQLNSSLITRYMELMCEFCEEKDVLNFIRNHEDIQLELALKCAKKYNLNRVEALLLERQGDYRAAFDTLFSRLQECVDKNINVEETLEELLNLIRRSPVLDANNTWLPLLNYLSNLKSHKLLRHAIRNVDLNLSSEFHLLLQNNSGMLGDFRDLITGLFHKYAYEYSILKSVSKIVYCDIHAQLAKTIATCNQGVSSPQICNLCQLSFTNKLLLFKCGHGYHEECAESLSSKCSLCLS